MMTRLAPYDPTMKPENASISTPTQSDFIFPDSG
jgi:hypothetical protein